MKESGPWFKFFPQRWQNSKKVRQMTCEEQGIFIQLLCYSWVDDGIKESEIQEISSVLQVDFKCTSSVLEKVFILEGDIYRNPVQEEIRKEKNFALEASSRGGKKSAEKRSGLEVDLKGTSSIREGEGEGEGEKINKKPFAPDGAEVPKPAKEKKVHKPSTELYNFWISEYTRLMNKAPMQTTKNQQIAFNALLKKYIDSGELDIETGKALITWCLKEKHVTAINAIFSANWINSFIAEQKKNIDSKTYGPGHWPTDSEYEAIPYEERVKIDEARISEMYKTGDF